MHSNPSFALTITESAHADVKAKTGLDCVFQVIGSGFFRTYDADNLVNFTNFTVLSAQTIASNLEAHDGNADYFWDEQPDFSSSAMLPNMQLLADAYQAGKYPFFIDETLHISN
jgi:hypothetical protein